MRSVHYGDLCVVAAIVLHVGTWGSVAGRHLDAQRSRPADAHCRTSFREPSAPLCTPQGLRSWRFWRRARGELFQYRRGSQGIAKGKAVATCSVGVHLPSSWLDQNVNEMKDRFLALLDVIWRVQLRCIDSPPVTWSPWLTLQRK